MSRGQLVALFKEVSPVYLVVLYLVLVVALGVFVSSLLLYPQELRIAEKKRLLQQEELKVAAVENYILAHPDVDKRLAELQQSLLRVEKALPGSMDVSVFMGQLQKDATEAGVRVLSVRPSAMVERTGYREMPVEVSLQGSFFQVMALFKKLEDGERFSLPNTVLIQKNQEILTARINLLIFSFGNTPRPTAAAGAAGPPAAPAR